MEQLVKNLIEIQGKLKVPKNLKNDFAGFNYRSAEGIEKTAKPLCHERGLALILSDEIVDKGGWNYIKSTAKITDGKNEIAVDGWAREQEIKKGMDSAQITGSVSSYARKYALTGLFAIDDSKDDPDSQDNSKQVTKKEVDPDLATGKQWNMLFAKFKAIGLTTKEEIKNYLEVEYEVKDGQLTKDVANVVIKDLIAQEGESDED